MTTIGVRDVDERKLNFFPFDDEVVRCILKSDAAGEICIMTDADMKYSTIRSALNSARESQPVRRSKIKFYFFIDGRRKNRIYFIDPSQLHTR